MAQKIQNDALRQILTCIFGGSRTKFLNEFYYPEIARQLDHHLTRFKITPQLKLACSEQMARRRPSSVTSCESSFAELSTKTLDNWIEKAEQLTSNIIQPNAVFDGLPATLPNITPSPLTLLDTQRQYALSYSFISYDNFRCFSTAKLVAESRLLEHHPSYLASKAKLGAMIPYIVPTAQTNERPDSVQKPNNDENLKELMCFLSYGTFKYNM